MDTSGEWIMKKKFFFLEKEKKYLPFLKSSFNNYHKIIIIKPSCSCSCSCSCCSAVAAAAAAAGVRLYAASEMGIARVS